MSLLGSAVGTYRQFKQDAAIIDRGVDSLDEVPTSPAWARQRPQGTSCGVRFPRLTKCCPVSRPSPGVLGLDDDSLTTGSGPCSMPANPCVSELRSAAPAGVAPKPVPLLVVVAFQLSVSPPVLAR